LRRKKEERYQTVKELALDLKTLKQELDVEARLERSSTARSSDRPTQSTPGQLMGAARTTSPQVAALPTSYAEYLVNEIKRHRLMAALAAGAAIVMVATVAYFYIARPNNFAASGETIDSLAVLPFINSTADPNTEYLADGLSDSIIDKLSHLPTLKKVISLNSVLHYKGKQIDAQAVGSELNVRAVLIGRLAQHGDDLLISTELVDVKDDKRLWGGQYNIKATDVLKLQGEIAQQIADRLQLKLTAAENQLLGKNSTDDSEAYRLYLLGRFYRRSRTEEGLPKGIDYLEQAIKKDPNYAAAYAQLAFAYTTLRFKGRVPPNEGLQKMETLARRALELDEMLGDAHAASALAAQDWSGRIREFQRALELDPNSADVHHYYAVTLLSKGRSNEAIFHQQRALELDPLSPVMYLDLGTIFDSTRQYDQAIEQCQKALELNPNYAVAHNCLAGAYLAKGKYQEALTEAKKASANKSSGDPGHLGLTYAALGKKAEALKILNELQQRSKESHNNAYHIALIYAGLGNKERAFVFLQKQYEENPAALMFVKAGPEFDSLRSDPRFTELLRRLNLVD
jgi:TolB-like protein/Tfp pilus assembly protein PilF